MTNRQYKKLYMKLGLLKQQLKREEDAEENFKLCLKALSVLAKEVKP